MSQAAKKKFSSQVDPELLEELKEIAQEQGRQLQAVLHDAMRQYVEHVRGASPRDRVLAHFRASLERNRRLGELLAK